MKLIEMLVKETIENGWSWPVGCNSIAQDEYHGDREGDIYAYVNALNGGNYWFEDNDSGYGKLLFKGYEVAEDAATSLVTREQYEAALAAKNEGWIEWGGGECQVPRGTLVDVKYLCGDVNRHIKAGEPDSSGSIDTAFAVRWSKLGAEYDIIAYRLHQPQEAVHSEAGDEPDLNECIDNDAEPVWNGEGLPPVGCFCEVEYLDGMLVYGQGESGEVVAHVENTAVIRMSYGLGCFEAGFIRPLRTEAERKRDKAIEEMIKIATIYTTKSLSLDLALNSIYNAIESGEIPGVKLED